MTTKAIIMGGGESLYQENVIDVIVKAKKENPELLNDTIIMSTDRTLKHVLEKGIIPEYTCIQENLYPPTRYHTVPQTDYLVDFFKHDIVKKFAPQITLYYAQALRWYRTSILKAMGFKMKRFNRMGLGGNVKPLIYTCGHCSQALVSICREVLKIDKIATIGMDMDFSRSWKIYETDVHSAQKNMLTATLKQNHTDFIKTGKPIYNLTRMGKFHYTGVVETNIEDFLKS